MVPRDHMNRLLKTHWSSGRGLYVSEPPPATENSQMNTSGIAMDSCLGQKM